MKYSAVGKSGLKISALGLGCWKAGGGKYWGEFSQKETDAVVSCALDGGVTYFDTAEVYNDGASETALGISLRSKRSRAVIGSKVSTSHARPDLLRRSCEASLGRLGTDYIDLYMLHWPLNRISAAHFGGDKSAAAELPAVSDVFGTLCDLRSEGKIREIGLSNHGTQQMSEVLPFAGPAVNELPYNLLCRAIESGIMPFCREKNIAVIGYMALMQGILTDKYKTIGEIPPPQAHSRHFRQERGGDFSRHGEEGAEAETELLLDGLRRISLETGIPQSVLAFSWTLREGTVASSLTGSGSAENLLMNIRAADTVLPGDILSELDRLSRPVWDRLGNSADYYENRARSRIC